MGKKRSGHRLILIILCIIVIWLVRVIYVNQKYKSDTVYLEINKSINCGNIVIIPSEVKLLTTEEYEAYFGTKIDENTGVRQDDRLICLKFRVKNISDNEIDWNDVFGIYGEGFETLTWGSSCNPMLERKINVVYDDMFAPGAEIELWRVSSVSRRIFEDKTWDKMSTSDFVFVFSLSPKIIKIRLK